MNTILSVSESALLHRMSKNHHKVTCSTNPVAFPQICDFKMLFQEMVSWIVDK